MPTIHLTEHEAKMLRLMGRQLEADGEIHPTSEGSFGIPIMRWASSLPPEPLVAGDIVRSNGDKSIVGTVLGVKGGYVCFETDSSVGYGNPFRIMLAELLERV